MIRTNTLSIFGLLAEERIRVGLEVESKEEAINAVIDLLRGSAMVKNIDQVRSDVFDREAILSTGVGKGLALPHARTAAVSDTLMAFVVTKQPVDYGSLDGEDVRLILLLVGPESERVTHVRLLGRISRLMNDVTFRADLLEASDAAAILDIFRQAEEAYG